MTKIISHMHSDYRDFYDVMNLGYVELCFDYLERHFGLENQL